MRRVLSWKRLLVVVAVLLTVSAATYGVHTAQVRRHSSALKERAEKAEEAAAADPAKVDEAVQLYQQYLRYRPKDEDAYRRYARLQFDRAKADPKKSGEAAQVGENFLRQFPNHPEERRLLIDLYARLGKVGNARQHLQILFAAPAGGFGEDIELLEKAAEIEFDSGDPAAGIGHLKKAVDTRKAPVRVYERLLQAYQRYARQIPGSASEAEGVARELTEEEPYKSDIAAWVVAARYRIDRKDLAAARKYLDHVRGMPGGANHADVLIAQARLELNEIKGPETVRPQWEKARQLLEAAHTANPKNVPAGLFLAEILAWQGESKKAVDVLRRSAEALGERDEEVLLVVDQLLDLAEQDLAPRLVDRLAATRREDDTVVKYFRGRLAVLKSDWPRARALLEEVLPILARSRVPNFQKKALAGLGRCYEAFQNPDKQYEHHNAAFAIDPLYPPSAVGRADALYRLGRSREALTAYKTLVGSGYTALRPRLARLEMRAVLSQPEAARSWDAFEAALGPPAERTAELHVLHAESLVARGSPDKAAEVLEDVVRKDPKAAAAAFALARVRSGGKPEALVAALDAAQQQLGDTVDIRLARASVLAGRAKPPLPAELRALGGGDDKFGPADRHRLWAGLGDAAVRAGARPDTDAAALRGLAIECYQKATAADPRDLTAWGAVLDLALADGRQDVVDAALAGITAAEPPNGPMGSLARVVVRLPAVKKIEDKAARAAEIQGLRELAERAKRERPGWGRVYVALGQLDELEGFYDRALNNYKEAIDKGERQPFVIRRAFELYRARRQDDQAARLLNSLYAEVPLPEDLERFRVVRDLLARDIPQSERPTIDRIAPKDATDWRVLLLRGALLAAIRHDDDALAAFKRAVELGDDSPETWAGLVAHLVRLDRLDEARRAVAQAEERLKANPPKGEPARAELILTLAGCHELIGDPAAAEARYREAARVAPRELNPNKHLVLFLQRAGKVPEADGMLRRLVDDPGQDLARWARRHLALSLVVRPDGYTRRAEALALVQRNLDAGGKDPEDEKARAVVLTVDPATRDDGIKVLKEYARFDQLTPDEYLVLARLHFDQGVEQVKMYEAVEFFEKAARPGSGVAVYHLTELVRVHLALNNLDRAKVGVARLKALAPRSWEAAREEARLLHRQAADAERNDRKDEAAKLAAQARGLVLNFPGSQTEAMIPGQSGPMLEELGFPADAEALYTKYMSAAKDPAPHLPLAVFLLSQKRTDEAAALAWKYADRAPPVVTARILTGVVRVKRAGGGPWEGESKAEAWLQGKLNEYQGKRGEERAYAALVGTRAELLDAQGKYDEAIAEYQRAIGLGKTDLLVNNLAMLLVLHRPERADEAIRMMDELIAVRGPSPTFLDTRAVAYLVKGGKVTEAVRDLQLALLQRKRAVYLFHLAWAYDLMVDKPERAYRDVRLKEAKDLGLTVADLHPLEARKFHELYRTR